VLTVLRTHFGKDASVNPDADQRRTQRELVRSGYDTISVAYRDDRGYANPSSAEDTAAYKSWIDELAALMQPESWTSDAEPGCQPPASW
jgi:hypothetical protein